MAISTLRGAIYANVVNATDELAAYGEIITLWLQPSTGPTLAGYLSSSTQDGGTMASFAIWVYPTLSGSVAAGLKQGPGFAAYGPCDRAYTLNNHWVVSGLARQSGRRYSVQQLP